MKASQIYFLVAIVLAVLWAVTPESTSFLFAGFGIAAYIEYHKQDLIEKLRK